MKRQLKTLYLVTAQGMLKKITKKQQNSKLK